VVPGKQDRSNLEQKLYLSYGLNFFNYTLKNNKSAKTYLDKQPLSYGFNEEFTFIEYSKGKAQPPGKSDLIRVLETDGLKTMELLIIDNLGSENPVINTQLVGQIAQDYLFAKKKPKIALSITDIATRLFPDDYFGPYLAGYIYNQQKDHVNKIKFYQIAKKRLLVDTEIDQDKKTRRLKQIE